MSLYHVNFIGYLADSNEVHGKSRKNLTLAGSTYKKKMIQGVLDDLVDLVLGFVWLVWFFLSHIDISAILSQIFSEGYLAI